MAKPKATTTSVKPTTTTAPERSEEPKITVSSDDGGSGGWGWGVVAARGVALLGGAGVGTMSRRANRSGLRRPTLVGIVLGAALLVAGCGEAGVTLGQSKDSTSAWTAASPRSSLCSAWDSRPTWTGLELELDASDAQAPATVLPATRTYLGDLSGGFFVGKRIREIYGLTPDGGASVFDFPEIVGPGAWKQRYRDNLDALEWSAEEQQAFVDEAKTAYLHHSKVFDELAELQPGSGLFHWWWRSEGCFGVTGSASGGGGVLGAGLGCCRPSVRCDEGCSDWCVGSVR